MKYCILVPDGCAGLESERPTPLEKAATPNMDLLAEQGICGLVQTIPENMKPGSDVANISLLGFDPAKYYTGRSPIEAASMGIDLEPEDTSFRCNLVRIHDGKMADYSAGHITTPDAHAIIDQLNRELKSDTMEFFPGVSYRHAFVLRNKSCDCECTPPHDISGQEIQEYLPGGPGSQVVIDIQKKAGEILKDMDSANAIWLWGQGGKPAFPSLKEQYGISGGMISAVDLLKGIAIYLGMDIIDVPGITGYMDTNFSGKGEAASEALERMDLVFVHVEAPDEAGHRGEEDTKIKAIELIDSLVLPPIMKTANTLGDMRIMVVPDHTTPISTMTHGSEPVPFIITGPGIHADANMVFSEANGAETGLFIPSGPDLLNRFLFE